MFRLIPEIKESKHGLNIFLSFFGGTYTTLVFGNDRGNDLADALAAGLRQGGNGRGRPRRKLISRLRIPIVSAALSYITMHRRDDEA